MQNEALGGGIGAHTHLYSGAQQVEHDPYFDNFTKRVSLVRRGCIIANGTPLLDIIVSYVITKTNKLT